ncbi:MAG: hypothetical protein U9P11_03835 [Pseudomonadota bacterium]|nr:hypothetical protein [Pseudomonadota bacterium]
MAAIGSLDTALLRADLLSQAPVTRMRRVRRVRHGIIYAVACHGRLDDS